MIDRRFKRILAFESVGWRTPKTFENHLLRWTEQKVRNLMPRRKVRSGCAGSARVDDGQVAPPALFRAWVIN